MPTTIVHRGLTVWINPVEQAARIQVHMPGYDNVHFVHVQPADGGWAVTDDREDRLRPSPRGDRRVDETEQRDGDRDTAKHQAQRT